MTTSNVTGSISGLYRFPVKSMGGEQVEVAELTGGGILGDRAYAIIDSETGKVASAKSVRHFPGLLDCKAAFVTEPRTGDELPAVIIALPDGTTVTSDSGDADRVLSRHFNRPVTLASTAPEDFTIDMYHPDVEGADPGGKKDEFGAQKLGAALFASMGVQSPVPVGSFFDVFPVSVLTTSTLAQLQQLEPETNFDLRRFRMNVIVETEQPGFVENEWVGHELLLGDRVRLGIAMADPRCVMTTLAQDDLAADMDVMRALVRHNKIPVGDLGQRPVAGVYAGVVMQGELRTGDAATLVSGE